MYYRKKAPSALICLLFVLSLLALSATPVLAKGFGGGGRGGGFSSGGRSGFSSAPKVSSPAKSSSGYSSKPGVAKQAATGSGRSAAVKTNPGQKDSSSSYGKGFTNKTEDFSTPRQGNPPSMYKDYNAGKGDFSTGKTSYSTGRQSYNGTWDRSAAPENDRFPQKQPISIYGAPPQPPYYYNNNYWGMPWWSHLFFQPNYYHTPWGYHYFAPRFLTWILLFGFLGIGGLFLYNSLRRRGY